MRAVHRVRYGAALGLAALLVSGCASTQEPDVQRVATAFEDYGADPAARCDLLTSKALVALEQSEAQSCADAIGQPETHGGGKVSAAACTPTADAPYDCEVTAG